MVMLVVYLGRRERLDVCSSTRAGPCWIRTVGPTVLCACIARFDWHQSISAWSLAEQPSTGRAGNPRPDGFCLVIERGLLDLLRGWARGVEVRSGMGLSILRWALGFRAAPRVQVYGMPRWPEALLPVSGILA
jgi:hypothetical protein